jgi:hypothetical protein
MTSPDVPSHMVAEVITRHRSCKEVYETTEAVAVRHALICVAITPNMRVVTMTFLLLQSDSEFKSYRAAVESL